MAFATIEQKRAYMTAYFEDPVNRERRRELSRIRRAADPSIKERERDRQRAVRARAKATKLAGGELPDCHFCGGAFRAFDWHGERFVRCGSCGLETTAVELVRIKDENLGVAA